MASSSLKYTYALMLVGNDKIIEAQELISSTLIERPYNIDKPGLLFHRLSSIEK